MKFSIKLKYLILSVLAVISLQDDSCNTPFECYTKSMELLKRDRDEMRLQRDYYEKMYNELARKVEALEREKFSEKISEVKQYATDAVSGVSSKLDLLYSQINSKWEVLENHLGTFRITNQITAIRLLGVPETARKVLVFANIFAGQSAGDSGELRLFTWSGGKQQIRLLSYFAYPQNAYSSNSGNFEFDRDGTDLNVYLQGTSNPSGNIYCYLKVIGYK